MSSGRWSVVARRVRRRSGPAGDPAAIRSVGAAITGGGYVRRGWWRGSCCDSSAPFAVVARRRTRQAPIRRRLDLAAAVAGTPSHVREVVTGVIRRRRDQRTADDHRRDLARTRQTPVAFDDRVGRVVAVDHHRNAGLAGNDQHRPLVGRRAPTLRRTRCTRAPIASDGRNPCETPPFSHLILAASSKGKVKSRLHRAE